ncbi:MAG: PRC-barrel domain-containing protein [Actinomycetota bacterium]|nr:PRC-barrel domain-containing protein [Actinomycetota bacterium]
MPRDLIHRVVTDPYDDRIGYVRDLLIDEADWKVRFLHVTVGGHLGFHDHHFQIPIEAFESERKLRDYRAGPAEGAGGPGARSEHSVPAPT